MIKQEEVYKIGRIGKSHGVHGEVTLQFEDDVFDRVDADYLVLDVDGLLVPFFIEEYRFRSDTTALMKFEDVDTQQRARELTNCDVYFPRDLIDDADEELCWSHFIGFDLIDEMTSRSIGHIVHVDDQTTNILFELNDGRLIPAAEELIASIDKQSHTICMTLPEGLLDL